MKERARPRASKESDHLKLAKLRPDLDTRNLFADCMKDAERGDVVGAIVVLMHSRKTKNHQLFSVHLAGSAATNPIYTAGVGASVGTLLREASLQAAGLKPPK